MLLGMRMISANNIANHLLVTADLITNGLGDGSHHIAGQLALACTVMKTFVAMHAQDQRVQDACGGPNTEGSTIQATGHKSGSWGKHACMSGSRK